MTCADTSRPLASIPAPTSWSDTRDGEHPSPRRPTAVSGSAPRRLGASALTTRPAPEAGRLIRAQVGRSQTWQPAGLVDRLEGRAVEDPLLEVVG
jgi:hypothetical protein